MRRQSCRWRCSEFGLGRGPVHSGARLEEGGKEWSTMATATTTAATGEAGGEGDDEEDSHHRTGKTEREQEQAWARGAPATRPLGPSPPGAASRRSLAARRGAVIGRKEREEQRWVATSEPHPDQRSSEWGVTSNRDEPPLGAISTGAQAKLAPLQARSFLGRGQRRRMTTRTRGEWLRRLVATVATSTIR